MTEKGFKIDWRGDEVLEEMTERARQMFGGGGDGSDDDGGQGNGGDDTQHDWRPDHQVEDVLHQVCQRCEATRMLQPNDDDVLEEIYVSEEDCEPSGTPDGDEG